MNLDVAETIREQIGTEAMVLLGAHMLLGDKNSLQFKIKGSPKGATSLIITLDHSSDLYTVAAYRVEGFNVVELSKVEGLYVEQLHDTLETATGLYVSFKPRRPRAPRR